MDLSVGVIVCFYAVVLIVIGFCYREELNIEDVKVSSRNPKI